MAATIKALIKATKAKVEAVAVAVEEDTEAAITIMAKAIESATKY